MNRKHLPPPCLVVVLALSLASVAVRVRAADVATKADTPQSAEPTKEGVDFF